MSTSGRAYIRRLLIPRKSTSASWSRKVAQTLERIAGYLNGLAAGDAIGKQTETLSRDDVRRWYPDGVRGFEGTPGSVIPRYVGNRKHAWTIGETTDDTEGTVAVARAILQDGAPHHVTIGRHLLECRKS